jgi:hypothetical protein
MASVLFSEPWMQAYAEAWNAEHELSGALERIHFNSNIAYGYPDEPTPRGLLVVENGKVMRACAFDPAVPLNWDLRAKAEQWERWFSDPPGMTGFGFAFTTGKIKFRVGDFGAMMKDPRMMSPFIKSFGVMGRIPRA